MLVIDSVEGNQQRLDGGAMFGNCPRALWAEWAPPDELNRITLGCRGMLVRDGARTVLFEAGVGAFFEPKMRERYGVIQKEHVLLDSLAALGLTHDQVDVVVLSHLHFDHAGGLLAPWQQGEPPRLLFPNATFVVGRAAWQRATAPHPRDRASFVPELNALLEASGRLELIDSESSVLDSSRYRFSFSDGHTPGLTLSTVKTPRGSITFVGDLIPGAPWVHLPITMGYDRYPELLIDEKRALLETVEAEAGWVFFTHDPRVAASRVSRDDKGKFRTTDALPNLHWSFE